MADSCCQCLRLGPGWHSMEVCRASPQGWAWLGGVGSGACGHPAFPSEVQPTLQALPRHLLGRLVGPQPQRSQCFLALRTKSQRKAGGGSTQPCDSIVVAYYFCGEPIPYRTLVRGRAVTLGQFKELLTKKGNYR